MELMADCRMVWMMSNKKSENTKVRCSNIFRISRMLRRIKALVSESI